MLDKLGCPAWLPGMEAGDGGLTSLVRFLNLGGSVSALSLSFPSCRGPRPGFFLVPPGPCDRARASASCLAPSEALWSWGTDRETEAWEAVLPQPPS